MTIAQEGLKIKVKDVPWSDRIERLINELNPLIGVGTTKRLVQEKRIFIHEVFIRGLSIGFYMGRVDTLANCERDLVIIHAVSDVKGSKPLIHILSVLYPTVAKDLGCCRVRIHSDNRKIDSLLEASGYKHMETVFSRTI